MKTVPLLLAQQQIGFFFRTPPKQAAFSFASIQNLTNQGRTDKQIMDIRVTVYLNGFPYSVSGGQFNSAITPEWANGLWELSKLSPVRSYKWFFWVIF